MLPGSFTTSYTKQHVRMKRTQYIIILIFGLLSCDVLGQNKQIGEIPFIINESGWIIIELQINKERISKFVLDTGASVTIIDDDIADQLKLSLEVSESESIGASGVTSNGKKTIEQQIYVSDKVILKGIKLSVRDLSHLGKINGIIGFDLFRNFVSQINFDIQKVTFYKKKGKPNTDGYQAVNFVESYCTPEVDVTFSLEDGKTFSGKALFDTGNTASPLIINSPYKAKENLPSKFKSLITVEGRGIHSKTQSVQGVIKSLKLGEYELGEMTATLSNTDKGVLSWEGYLGLLGLEYISKFNFIIDYHRKKIYLKPNNSFSNSFEFPVSGISLKEEKNEIMIRTVSKPSDAYNQGLREGQKIISINGIEGGSKTFYKNLLKSEGEEVTIIVKLENGELKTVEITLKRLI